MAITRRMSNKYNSSANVVNVLPGIERTIVREGTLQSSTETLSPGCIVVPATGAPPATVGYHGATTRFQAPTGAVGTSWSVLDITSGDGGTLLSEYNEGDQVSTITRAIGATFNVRIAGTAVVAENTVLSASTTGNGFVVPGNANPIGIARENLVVSDPSLPTYILMEVI